MSKHTPGPWLRDGRTVYALMSVGFRRGVEQFANRFWAGVQAGPECSDEETEAIARLMEAAPELLEALIKLEAMAERYRPQGAPLPDAQKQARAAIAKATGDQP
jgi:hypothetical protein